LKESKIWREKIDKSQSFRLFVQSKKRKRETKWFVYLFDLCVNWGKRNCDLWEEKRVQKTMWIDLIVWFVIHFLWERKEELKKRTKIVSLQFSLFFHKIIEMTNWIIREENPFSREWIGEQWKRVTLKRERNYFFFWKNGISTKLSIFWVLIGLKFDDFMFRT